jgi:hypothetical protein
LIGISPRFDGTNTDLPYLPRAARWVLVLSISVAALSNNASSFAQSLQPSVAGTQETPTVAQQPTSDKRQSGGISGTVIDQDGAVIADVKIILTQPAATSSGATSGPTSTKEAHSDGEGHFAFAEVAAGPFQLSLTASGFAPLTMSGTLHAGEDDVLTQIVLAVARNTVDVEVTLPQAQIAEDQVKVEEKQRLLGVFPNFYVTYDPKAVPLTTKLKFQLAWKTTVDPVSFAIIGGIAGIEQANNAFSGYGQGAQGYAKRLGAAYADFVSGTFIGSAILPSLLKQDPRYFVKGTGTVRARFLYAVANSVVCKGDNRRWQPNYSFIVGDLAAGGISNLYYPAQNRNGATLTFENALIAIGGGAVGNVIQEFFLRKLTPHSQDQNVPAQNPAKP